MKRTFLLSALAGLLLAVQGSAFDTRDTPVSAQGVRATADLPASQHMRNTGGNDLAPDRWGRPTNPGRVPGQGSGLCVFTSIEHSGRWQNIGTLAGFQKWMTNQEGGGWPAKVDVMLKRFCASKSVPVPPYIQHEGGDDEFLEIALRTDRMVCVTYDGRDGFYAGAVGHMVNLVHLDSKSAAIVDNNRPGKWIWMTRAEFLSRWRGTGGGWAIVFLDNPPPPYPSEPKQDFSLSPCGCKDCKCIDCNCYRGTVFGQNCPGGVCPLPTSPSPQRGEGTKADGWHEQTISGELVRDLWQDGKLVGRLRDDGWHPAFAGGVLSQPEALPVGVIPPAAANAEPLTGVVPGMVGKAKRYSKDGKECEKHVAFAALTSGLYDDSSRWHLTAVGSAEFVAAVKADLGNLPPDLKAQIHFQGYGPSDWPVAQFLLPAGLSLRKPSPVRVGADVGLVVTGDYGPGKLIWLLQQSGGPLPPPVPTPMPPPDPVPTPAPVPAPVEPSMGSRWQNWLLAAAILVGVWFIRRSAQPKPA